MEGQRRDSMCSEVKAPCIDLSRRNERGCTPYPFKSLLQSVPVCCPRKPMGAFSWQLLKKGKNKDRTAQCSVDTCYLDKSPSILPAPFSNICHW